MVVSVWSYLPRWRKTLEWRRATVKDGVPTPCQRPGPADSPMGSEDLLYVARCVPVMGTLQCLLSSCADTMRTNITSGLLALRLISMNTATAPHYSLTTLFRHKLDNWVQAHPLPVNKRWWIEDGPRFYTSWQQKQFTHFLLWIPPLLSEWCCAAPMLEARVMKFMTWTSWHELLALVLRSTILRAEVVSTPRSV